MKKLLRKMNICFMIIVLVLLLSSCNGPSQTVESSGSVNGDQSKPQGELEPTGYPTGEIQYTYVFYDGQLYWYEAAVFTLDKEKMSYIGTVQSVDNIELPDEDFEASRLGLGTVLYKDNKYDYLYAAWGDGKVGRLKPAEEQYAENMYHETNGYEYPEQGEMGREKYREACHIDEEVLLQMEVSELVKSVETYPFVNDIFLCSSSVPEDQVQFLVSSGCDALAELLTRKNGRVCVGMRVRELEKDVAVNEMLIDMWNIVLEVME